MITLLYKSRRSSRKKKRKWAGVSEGTHGLSGEISEGFLEEAAFRQHLKEREEHEQTEQDCSLARGTSLSKGLGAGVSQPTCLCWFLVERPRNVLLFLWGQKSGLPEPSA